MSSVSGWLKLAGRLFSVMMVFPAGKAKAWGAWACKAEEGAINKHFAACSAAVRAQAVQAG